jgi:hypothetical protein
MDLKPGHYKIEREFVKDIRKENTAEDLWTGSRGGYLEN